MSSRTPDDGTESSRGSEGIWHPAHEWLENDELDTDYHPALEPSEHDGAWEDDIPNEDQQMGSGVASENTHINIGNIQIELTADDSESEDTDDLNEGHTRVPASRLFELLASSGLQHILQANGWPTAMEEEQETLEDEDDELSDEDFMPIFRNRLRARRSTETLKLPPVPNPEGKKLMSEGHFGTDQFYGDRLRQRKKFLATSLMWRELGIDTDGVRKRAGQSISQGLIPSSIADKIIHYDTRSYSGQFSDDGNFFFCCAQDFKVRMYDTSNPYDWKYYKTVDYPFGQWTITDATLSPDNRFLVYSSIRSQAYMASTDPEDNSDPTVLDLSTPPGQRRRRSWGSSHFGIWSLRFSGDGREVVAGTSEDSVIVYDLETRQPVLNLRERHQHHVNAVCYGDTSSPHILYSGSDDTTIRVWDRRSMGDGREAGAFMGHTEGLTYVDSKGDGRYVLSNSKDQTMKLWDLRKMMTSADIENIDPFDYSTGFDYRFEQYPDQYRRNAKNDCSVVTYRGHRVLKTLIRCHFSPPGSTNSRYVYSGSEDGKVYVYNLDATLAGTIDVGQATFNSRPRDPDAYATAYEMSGEMLWRTCVRDASWHPNAPVLAATSWNGWGLSTGTCTVHSWNAGAAKDEGDPPAGKSYDDRLRHIPEFDQYRESAPHGRPRRPLRSRPVRRWVGDEEAEDAIW
ncbi:LEC14B protein [Penicillium chrysogenum]|uniref:LEC14B protein n=1 Tax=Penicillium chrysogenum TaxID=5076 RepID=A0A167SLJ8_PENCH|nr:uncharacterized protein N7525_008727 [Penicillium rubens]KAJ5048136.1 hypothetical protein NUH16_006634 [Penicillium rubens]KAJ5830474.1 hypothetical protein N7525_008727 [Penicillium rubens]KAJ5854056.1 hypothetical protein N7534_006599 [Penicillium rubens]KZN87323.1 LEC14B protein [Penicillium chrysogenum]